MAFRLIERLIITTVTVGAFATVPNMCRGATAYLMSPESDKVWETTSKDLLTGPDYRAILEEDLSVTIESHSSINKIGGLNNGEARFRRDCGPIDSPHRYSYTQIVQENGSLVFQRVISGKNIRNCFAGN